MPRLNPNLNRGSMFDVPRSPRLRGFSLLELGGVLAIISIIAAATVPVVIKRIDMAARTKEIAALSAMADSVNRYVVRSNTIPDTFTPTSFAQAVASQLDIAQSDVTTTPRGFTRGFLTDATAWFYGLAPYDLGPSGPNGGTSPYGLTFAPANARLLIVSTLGGKLPSAVTNNAYSLAQFNQIWDTQQGTKPTTGIWTNYKGSADDLVIQRVNLQPLFHRIILVNNDVGSTPRFRINGTINPAAVTNGSGWNCYYLDGAILGLCDTNASALVSGQEVIRKDISRVFENSYWRDEIDVGVHTNGYDFGTIAALFFNSPPPAGSKWGVKPPGIANALSAFMYGYAAWANQTSNGTNFCFGYDPGAVANNKATAEYALIQNALACFTAQGGGARVAPYP